MSGGASIPAVVNVATQPEQLRHHWEVAVGSGHAALALRSDWQAHLRRCRLELGIQRVRFHGILGDDLGTHVIVSDKPMDSFRSVDVLTDAITAAGMGLFVEWSFMPTALASGGETVFNYRGNITPPKDMSAWTGLISRLSRRWLDRYGLDELRRWRFEVWNEPNLPQFWTGSQDQYFQLYHHTACALKQVDRRLQVGGPVTAKNAWLPEFVSFCARNGSPLDFVSTHHYPTDAFGNESSDIVVQLAKSPRATLHDQAAAARAQVGGLPLHYTEWSITSSPHDAQHDLPIAAAYVIHAIMGVRGIVDGYSHWTFSDVFTENYMPSLPFHGGFGLLTLHGIPKPAYHAFRILHQLGHELWPIATGHPTVEAWLTRKGHVLTLVAVNMILPGQPTVPAYIQIRIEHVPAPLSALIERIDEDHGNPHRRWTEMGSPSHLLPRQVEQLMSSAQIGPEPHPYTYQDHVIEVGLDLPANGVAAIRFDLPSSSIHCAPVSLERQLAQQPDAELLQDLQRQAFSYFLFTAHPDTGLIPDTNQPHAPMSIGALGFALASYPVAVERGFLSRPAAVARAYQALDFLRTAEQGDGPQASGYQGFFYHFLDPASGRRMKDCELSTIDTTLMIAGALVAAAYFDRSGLDEVKLRQVVDELYRRINWTWALDDRHLVYQGWQPQSGFLPSRWEGYSEALLLYVLAAGSPTHPLSRESYEAFCATYQWRTVEGINYLHAGPLFIHQYPHCFLDLRGIRDAVMHAHDSDYADNSRRASLIQQRYAIAQKDRFRCYGPTCWGITASDGPGECLLTVDGHPQEFFGYRARGVPDGPDDGTIAPWAALACLPFAPEIVMPTIRHVLRLDLHRNSRHGFRSTVNLTYPQPGGWVGPWHFGINQGPAVILTENHRSGLIWRLMQAHPAIRQGLRTCGFSGGYLATP